MYILLTILVLKAIPAILADDCAQQWFDTKRMVCMCNSTQCHTITKVVRVESPRFLRYTSNEDGLRFEKTEGEFQNGSLSELLKIYIKSEQTYQVINGFGGAFTDSTGINILSLSNNTQENLIRSYFGDSGIEYSLGRVPIGGTDFSTRPYSYHDNNVDAELNNFALQEEDFTFKIPFIQKAFLLNPNLKLFAAAWIAPTWMRKQPVYSGGEGSIKSEYYGTWAKYFVKFLDAYATHYINFWGISTGNEPFSALLGLPIPSVYWVPSEQATWIADNLGPQLKYSNHSEINIIAGDDQTPLLPVVTPIFENENAEQFINGIGIHWYIDSDISYPYLDAFNSRFSKKFILATEACSGYLPISPHVLLGSWDRGEAYANSIIQDINHWSSGWVDWNMALNLEGGPTYISNFVDSPIIVNATNDEFYKQPMYYALGHFSKFVPNGSVRIGSTQFLDNVPVVAFKRPDNGTVVVILNKLDIDVRTTLDDALKGKINLKLTKKSITTIIYW